MINEKYDLIPVIKSINMILTIKYDIVTICSIPILKRVFKLIDGILSFTFELQTLLSSKIMKMTFDEREISLFYENGVSYLPLYILDYFED